MPKLLLPEELSFPDLKAVMLDIAPLNITDNLGVGATVRPLLWRLRAA